jgi:DNA invertase Pin-like site-specific DNA recombinase
MDVKWNLVGYARVSTDDQNLDLQLNALREAKVPEGQIFKEHISGVAKNRPQFEKAMKHLRRGDVLVVWKLDRLGRSLEELVTLIKSFDDRGIELRSLTEGIDTTTALGRLFYHMMAALAQFERDLISERTKAGLEAAKERGRS